MKKTCAKCQKEKALVEFHRDARSPDGYRARCSECRKEDVRDWYERTKEVRRERDRARNQDPRRRAARQEYMKTFNANPMSEERRIRRVASARKWQLENADRVLAAELKRRNGLDVETYDAMVAAQEGKCAICRQVPQNHRLAVDHCHKTDKVRGLLCRKCNVGIGNLEDDVSRVFAAAAYLLEHEDALEEMGIK